MNYELGERSNKYFYSLEKHIQDKKNIKMLINEDGHSLYKTDEILEEERRFYKSLYSSSINITKANKDHYNTITNKFCNKWYIEEEEENIVDINLTFKEEDFENLLSTFANNKSPGSDGLPIEF